jgi:hypothetical protein
VLWWFVHHAAQCYCPHNGFSTHSKLVRGLSVDLLQVPSAAAGGGGKPAIWPIKSDGKKAKTPPRNGGSGRTKFNHTAGSPLPHAGRATRPDSSQRDEFHPASRGHG